MKCRLIILLFLLLGFGDRSVQRIYAGGLQYDPILVLTTGKNFSGYTAEILRAEGFNAFQVASVYDEKISLAFLKKFDLVILGQGDLPAGHQQVFERFVKEGGNLIAFRPDKKLETLLGIRSTGNTIDEGYLAIDSQIGISRGITPEKMQFHGTADCYTVNDADQIAGLFTSAQASTVFPAVVMHGFGKGHAVAFAYNLPESIVMTRQGNPKNAAKEMDGIDGIRSMDMFTNGWVDTLKNTINQADEQMRLFSHCLEKLASYKKPLPRFWYFPDTLNCLVTLTNDGEDSREIEYAPQFADVVDNGAKMTLYIKETDLNSKEWVSKWVNQGFEMAAHFDDTRQAQNPDWKTMDTVMTLLRKKMHDKYGIDAIRTVTNHWFVWCGRDAAGLPDFSAQAKLEVKHGIGLDNNYARYDNHSKQGYFFGAMGTNQGNFTGSGLSMKFASREGEVLDLYQHLCNVYDQQYMEHNDSIGIYNCFKGLMDRSIYNGVYSFISIKAHNAEYFFSKVPLIKMLQYANEHKIPVWTTAKLLDFLKAKDEAAFKDIVWKSNRLSFKIASMLEHPNRITCMVPLQAGNGRVKAVSVDSKPYPYSVKSVKGFDYAFVSIKPGQTYTIEVSYSQ